MGFKPPINSTGSESLILTMCGSVIVNMVNTQKSPVVNSTTHALASISSDYRLPKFSVTTPAYYTIGFWMFLAPGFGMGAISLFSFIVMFQIVCFVSCFSTPEFLFWIEFSTHRNILS
jgi:hypothetical protein